MADIAFFSLWHGLSAEAALAAKAEESPARQRRYGDGAGPGELLVKGLNPFPPLPQGEGPGVR